MPIRPLLALTLLVWLPPLGSASAGDCDDLHARVCAGIEAAADCARLVDSQLTDAHGTLLSGTRRLKACGLVLGDRNTVDDLIRWAKARQDIDPRLIGLWHIDVERTMDADPKMRSMSADAKKKAMEQAQAFSSERSFEFTADGRAIVRMSGKLQSSTFKVVTRDGNTLTVEVRDKDGDTETMTFTVADSRLTMRRGDQTLVLRRR